MKELFELVTETAEFLLIVNEFIEIDEFLLNAEARLELICNELCLDEENCIFGLGDGNLEFTDDIMLFELLTFFS